MNYKYTPPPGHITSVPYHPYKTFTHSNHIDDTSQTRFRTIPEMFNHRKDLTADGTVFQLRKSDLVIDDCGELRVRSKRTKNQIGLILINFHTYHVGWSQDSKSMFSAIAMLLNGTGLDTVGCHRLCQKAIKYLRTCKHGSLFYLNPDGRLTEFAGPINAVNLKKYVMKSGFV